MAREMHEKDGAYRVIICVIESWSNPPRKRFKWFYYGPFATAAQARGIRTRKVKEFTTHWHNYEVHAARVEQSIGWKEVPDRAR